MRGEAVGGVLTVLVLPLAAMALTFLVVLAIAPY
ncbi:hypothetical protein A8924_7133 [Saccharopolyspora erythraea NRRL 2338]|uniref:Uncharacterized protein n=1 Tax=Saccharopolyspora erythraea (strain ATCC 11635 / DSM 40517 / JCM 4748 / NBRC 13426 / NCIMB 8594 / NRRL 2338) TaxID=405948 RepID=A4FPG7_SACEN|nr:hypothetical protein N599_21335 [Saccharopolyspora erythraea D]PFG99583.1 hypothetical protein A8924_7133 [Saccharopolyspora erythraea NRRL 2338]CAM05942.1 hypothetical protein SACE_6777 [Saccharopolyspora erythraea NRRL 2338]